MIDFQKLLLLEPGTDYIDRTFKEYEPDRNRLFAKWYGETGELGEIYPSQGLLRTPYDYLEHLGKTLMSEEELWETLKVRRYFLEIMNHPSRLESLARVQRGRFVPPSEVLSSVMDYSVNSGMALSIRDLGSVVIGANGKRISRRTLLASGPFVKLGKYARIPFASGAMPDVFGSPAALATVAMCHGLAGVPRNGVFSSVKRQVDLVKAVFKWMREEELVQQRPDKGSLLRMWKRNIMGVVEP
jgi:hypothetical protein